MESRRHETEAAPILAAAIIDTGTADAAAGTTAGNPAVKEKRLKRRKAVKRSRLTTPYLGAPQRVPEMKRQRSVRFDHVINLLLLGDSGTGKTALVKRFRDDTFEHSRDCTIALDIAVTTVESEKGEKIKLQIYDTAGHERFKSVIRTYYPSANGVMVIYDVTSQPTLDRVRQGICDARENCRDDVIIFVVGNKTDLYEERKSMEHKERLQEAIRDTATAAAPEAENGDTTWMQEVGVRGVHFVSAKTGHGVRQAFLHLVNQVIEQRHQQKPSRPEQPKTSVCTLL